MKTFEDLDCWKKIAGLRRTLGELVKIFPAHEKYRLTDQIIRAARSATSNIAEGYGRFHYQENIQYCRQTRGSLYELIEHLIVAKGGLHLARATHQSEERNRVLLGGSEWIHKLSSESKKPKCTETRSSILK